MSRLKTQVAAGEARNKHQLEHIQNLLSKIRSMRADAGTPRGGGNETSAATTAVSDGASGAKFPETAGDSLAKASGASAVSWANGDGANGDGDKEADGDDAEVITFSDSEL